MRTTILGASIPTLERCALVGVILISLKLVLFSFITFVPSVSMEQLHQFYLGHSLEQGLAITSLAALLFAIAFARIRWSSNRVATKHQLVEEEISHALLLALALGCVLWIKMLPIEERSFIWAQNAFILI